MMAGHISGNPTQDSFTEWLHTHYVSRDVLDKRLEELATELTTSVMDMMKNLQAAQQQQYQQFEQKQENNKQQSVHITSNGFGIGEQVYVSSFLCVCLVAWF
jgi:recombinational DNA repair ATPase RecF